MPGPLGMDRAQRDAVVRRQGVFAHDVLTATEPRERDAAGAVLRGGGGTTARRPNPRIGIDWDGSLPISLQAAWEGGTCWRRLWLCCESRSALCGRRLPRDRLDPIILTPGSRIAPHLRCALWRRANLDGVREHSAAREPFATEPAPFGGSVRLKAPLRRGDARALHASWTVQLSADEHRLPDGAVAPP
jgi:hypothetical protein